MNNQLLDKFFNTYDTKYINDMSDDFKLNC